MARWLNNGVTGSISWPRKQAEVEFGPYILISMPAADKTQASLHIDLEQYGIDGAKGMSIMNQLLSFATWIEDAPSDLLPGWDGNPIPVSVPRYSQRSPHGWVDFWHFKRQPLQNPTHRKALGIYREARNLQDLISQPYAVLGYYKILEIKFPRGEERRRWIEARLEQMLEGDELPDLQRLVPEAGNTAKAIAAFMYTEGRNAVAHMKFENSIDPDDVNQLHRLSLALPVFRKMARAFIIEELGISDLQAD